MGIYIYIFIGAFPKIGMKIISLKVHPAFRR